MPTNLDTRDTPTFVPFEEAAGRPRSQRRPSRSEPVLLVLPPRTWATRLYLPARRAADFGTALLLAMVSAPVILLAALAIKLTSRGPAFYTQVRTGRDGRAFTIYKLRTMIDNCESLTGPRWTIPGDPRITPVGWFLRRTHLDELPQLFNVLRGEMSLIGPRPERPEFVQELDRRIPGYQRRHEVLPGITGLAQVQLPPDTDLESVRVKLLYDLYYVRHQNPLLDLRIFLSTALHMVGLPCAMLQTLRIVPGPDRVETPETVPFAAPAAPRRRKQAA